MRVSSTPRPLGSIIDVSGILDHPHARVMTTEHVALAFITHDLAFSRRDAPELWKKLSP